MSVAIDFDYEPQCPASLPDPTPRLRAVGRADDCPDDRAYADGPEGLATVTALHRLPERATAAPLRLTRRGVRVMTVAVAVVACALVGVARMSAASAPATAHPVPASVVVRPGDTLWSIASRLVPQGDPRAEVARLQQLNRLGSADLVPGEVLRTR